MGVEIPDQQVLEYWARLEHRFDLGPGTTSSDVIAAIGLETEWGSARLRKLKRVRDACAHGAVKRLDNEDIEFTARSLTQALGLMMSLRAFRESENEDRRRWAQEGRADQQSRRLLLELFADRFGDAREHHDLPPHVARTLSRNTFYWLRRVRDEAAHPFPPPLQDAVSRSIEEIRKGKDRTDEIQSERRERVDCRTLTQTDDGWKKRKSDDSQRSESDPSPVHAEQPAHVSPQPHQPAELQRRWRATFAAAEADPSHRRRVSFALASHRCDPADVGRIGRLAAELLRRSGGASRNAPTLTPSPSNTTRLSADEARWVADRVDEASRNVRTVDDVLRAFQVAHTAASFSKAVPGAELVIQTWLSAMGLGPWVVNSESNLREAVAQAATSGLVPDLVDAILAQNSIARSKVDATEPRPRHSETPLVSCDACGHQTKVQGRGAYVCRCGAVVYLASTEQTGSDLRMFSTNDLQESPLGAMPREGRPTGPAATPEAPASGVAVSHPVRSAAIVVLCIVALPFVIPAVFVGGPAVLVLGGLGFVISKLIASDR